ncbi:MAG TPA: LutB/LldF family L-lactate oxidation iron-sulfur protein [Acidimicrobiales bacterium]|nr:LutB/LldF family L-lactate oxidation iron-sulfur protein [Acidimicrobiales bacterium]
MTRAWLPWPSGERSETAPRRSPAHVASFEESAPKYLGDARLRANLARATTTIRERRDRVLAGTPDWEELRDAGAAIKDRVLANLDQYLLDLERNVQARGGVVHWARDAEEANAIIVDLVTAKGETEVIKAKSLTTDELGLNEALAAAGIRAYETDLAELIVQLADDAPSHILVPAIHKGRAEVRDLFRRSIPNAPADLSDQPDELAGAARRYLRERFLSARIGITGANFAVAESGTVVVVESEGNARMTLTLPDVLITVAGIEKVVATWTDLEVMLQLLPRSATGERMNPYTSTWSGVHDGDGPQEFHLILLDNGRTNVLADPVGRQALRCIRCSACLNVCPVYQRVGGHAYGSVYPGPIGAILTPLMQGVDRAPSLPFASSLCGACYVACPVKIDIPGVLVELRAQVVEGSRRSDASAASRASAGAERAAMSGLAWVFAKPSRLRFAQRAAWLASRALSRHDSGLRRLPGPLHGWTDSRDAPEPAAQTFRSWWASRQSHAGTKA